MGPARHPASCPALPRGGQPRPSGLCFLADLPGRKPLLPQRPPQAAPAPHHRQLLRGVLQGSGQSAHSHSQGGGGGLSAGPAAPSAAWLSLDPCGAGHPAPLSRPTARPHWGGGRGAFRSLACVSRAPKAVLLQKPAPSRVEVPRHSHGLPGSLGPSQPPAGRRATSASHSAPPLPAPPGPEDRGRGKPARSVSAAPLPAALRPVCRNRAREPREHNPSNSTSSVGLPLSVLGPSAFSGAAHPVSL